jgi:hypothetical protein
MLFYIIDKLEISNEFCFDFDYRCGINNIEYFKREYN